MSNEMDDRWSSEPGTVVFDAIENLQAVDWPDEDWDGVSLQLHHLLSRIVLAVGPRPIYMAGAVEVKELKGIDAAIFGTDAVVRVSGTVLDPSINIYPNIPASIAIDRAPRITHPRGDGHLEYTVTYGWGTVVVRRTRTEYGDRNELLELLKSRLGARA